MRRAVFEQMRSALIFLLCSFAIITLSCSVAVAADNDGNRLKSVGVSQQDQSVVVSIKAYKPIGYRYTVYDSQDPRRIVVDLRGMDVSEINSPIVSDALPVSEVRISSFDLTSGKLGRVEILLSDDGDYNVTLNEDLLTLSLASVATQEKPNQLVAEKPAESALEQKQPEAVESGTDSVDLDAKVDQELVPSSLPAEIAPMAAAVDAKKVSAVGVEDERVVLSMDGNVSIYKYFTLTGPTRLVLDVYNVKPGFKKTAYKLTKGFKKLRVGVYKDKIRFVFDASKVKLPEFGVNSEGESVVVAWGNSKDSLSAPAPKPSAGPVAIDALDFYQQDATSVFAANVVGGYGLIKPEADGNIVRFGIKNATIGRELKRVFDSSAFPSSVRMITPYTVQRDYGQDVMFAVELKGPVAYRLDSQKDVLRFIAENDSFNEMEPASVELREVEITESGVVVDKTPSIPSPAAETSVADSFMSTAEGLVDDLVGLVPDVGVKDVEKDEKYYGQKITLVFDDADIRDILQLIADVSDTNIIAGDDVKGKLTIRLVDVPWDQALAIVLDIKGLGKVDSGNVLRIMPKEKLHKDETQELNMQELRRHKAPLLTRVIEVSYTDVGEIAKQIEPLLTPNRGKVTQDLRNKQVIVTDVDVALDEITALVRILDTPDRQVMIEARIVEANTTFSNDLGVNWGMSHDVANPATGDLSEVAVGGGGGFLLAPPSPGGVGSSGLAADFLFGRLGIDNTILDLRLSALESTGNGKVVSSPRVTTLNGVQATIEQGTEIPYQSVDDKGNPKTEFRDATIKLIVTPQINPDKSILMKINASNNTVGGLLQTSFGSIVSLNKKRAQTSVLVKDGETTVIGGVFIESDSEGESGVPLLMNIPIIGHLFKASTVSKERRELLIFITPRILN